jgi:hypothetical protein
MVRHEIIRRIRPSLRNGQNREKQSEIKHLEASALAKPKLFYFGLAF